MRYEFMDEVNQHIAALEKRIERLEQALLSEKSRQSIPDARDASLSSEQPSTLTTSAVADSLTLTTKRSKTSSNIESKQNQLSSQPFSADEDVDWVSKSLGFAGALVMLLAFAYVIGLGIYHGWLTPVRQLALAFTVGLAMVVGGVIMMRRHQASEGLANYYSLIPATGMGIWYLAILGAHFYYQLIDSNAALVMTALLSAMALAFAFRINHLLYAVFAVISAYSGPFLSREIYAVSMLDTQALWNVFGYFTLWSIGFSAYAIIYRSRLIYLLAFYFAFIGFDLFWQFWSFPHWQVALAYQYVQLALLVLAVALFYLKHREQLEWFNGWLHVPLLLLFYAMQYALLDSYLSEAATVSSIASAVVLLTIVTGLQLRQQEPLTLALYLANSYAAMVMLHAIYFETLTSGVQPWFAMGIMAGVAGYIWRFNNLTKLLQRPVFPYLVLAGILLALTYLQLLLGGSLNKIIASELYQLLFVVGLYGLYFSLREWLSENDIDWVVIYAAHLMTLILLVRNIDPEIAQSLSWVVLGVASLLASIRVKSLTLGQSALAIFGLSGVKVLLFDLAQSSVTEKAVVLFIIGVLLFASGLFYRRLQQKLNP